MSVQGSSPTASAFYATLARGLDDLDRTLASSAAFLSLPSLRAALALLRGAHGGLARLVASMHLPGGAAWLDEYMDEASRLCDACRVLRHGAAAVEGYAGSATQLASLLVQQPSSSSSRQVARAISTCRREATALKEENRALVESRADSLALRLSEGVPPDAKLIGGFNGFRGVLCATRMLTSFLLTLLSWAVLHYRLDDDAGPGPGAGDCGAAYFGAAFASALARAQQRAAAQAVAAAAGSGGGVMMHEFRRARAAVDDAKEAVERGGDVAAAAAELGLRAGQLRAGCDDVLALIDDLFDEVVETRQKLLDLCSSGN